VDILEKIASAEEAYTSWIKWAQEDQSAEIARTPRVHSRRKDDRQTLWKRRETERDILDISPEARALYQWSQEDHEDQEEPASQFAVSPQEQQQNDYKQNGRLQAILARNTSAFNESQPQDGRKLWFEANRDRHFLEGRLTENKDQQLGSVQPRNNDKPYMEPPGNPREQRRSLIYTLNHVSTDRSQNILFARQNVNGAFQNVNAAKFSYQMSAADTGQPSFLMVPV